MKTRSQTAIDEAVKGLLMLKHTPMPKPPKMAAATAFTVLATTVAMQQRPRRAGVKY